MRGAILLTDIEWFEFLRRQVDLDEVNFWRPSDTRTPHQLRPGTPVIFKLRKKHGGWIVGWGLFAKHSVLPAWLAWDAFEVKNGAGSFPEMRRRIERLRRVTSPSAAQSGDYPVGCLMLSQPVFLARDAWIAAPRDWPDNAVQGKSYDLTNGEGARVWDECQARAAELNVVQENPSLGLDDRARYGEPMIVKPRLGQGLFRLSVMDAYDRACAVTGEHSLPALEAAHIRPYGEGGRHEIPNGLLLRSDIHNLFDKGYVGVTPDHRFVVSKRLKQDFSNGRSYYPLDGRPIRPPSRREDHPDPSWLEWHMAERFRR